MEPALSVWKAELREHEARTAALAEAFHAKGRELQDAIGLSDADLEALEAQRTPALEDRCWRAQMTEVPTNDTMDGVLPDALAALERLVDHEWLDSQRAYEYRFDEAAQRSPLELVGTTRVSRQRRPQRFAEMLLLTRDYLDGRPDLDIYNASWAVPEVALLGGALAEIPRLGAEAVRKLGQLPSMPDIDVTATIFELAVGLAALRLGRKLEMLPASKTEKSPDYRVLDLGVPAAIECKRRQGLFEYEEQEADAARGLYDALTCAFGGSLAGHAFDVDVRVPLSSMHLPKVIEAAMAVARSKGSLSSAWGTITCRRLPLEVPLAGTTRLYSPELLGTLFGWAHRDPEWDGLICAVEPMDGMVADRVRGPGALRWRSSSEEALLKKARGVTSPFGKAVQQVPKGEMGIIYICYDERARTDIADARTREIMQACREWHHEGIKVIPMVIVARLYHCPKTFGVPDLIENALFLSSVNDKDTRECLLRTFPTLVFTPSR